MSYLPGDTLTEYILPVSSSGTPLTGLLFPSEDRVSLDPNGAPFPATVTEMGQGVYRVEYTTPVSAAHGEWFLKLRADDAEAQVFVCRWQVLGSRNRLLPGNTLTYTFVVLDEDGSDVIGATFPANQHITMDPLGNAFPITITEHGYGVYRASVTTATTDAPGVWLARFQDTQVPPNTYESEWTLLSRQQLALVYTPSFTGLTRRELRRMVLAKVGDLVLTTATANSGSSTWMDQDTLVGGDAGRWAGREMLITSGTPANVGQVRHIAASNNQGTLQFSRALPFPVFTGDEAEIVNTRGGGFTFQEVHNAINHCLRVANVSVPITAELGAFSISDRAIPIPGEFMEIDTVQYLDPTDRTNAGWQTLHAGRAAGQDGWAVDQASRTIVISGRAGHLVDGQTLRIYGRGKVPPLVTDDDTVDVHPEWLVNAAAAFLLLQAIGGPRALTPEWERKGSLFQQIADSLIDRTRPRRRPNTVRVQ